MMFKSEREMQTLAMEYIQSQGFECIDEVPFLSRSLDLVYKKDNEFYVLELKLKDWVCAIKQCRCIFLGTPHLYVCLPPVSGKVLNNFINYKTDPDEGYKGQNKAGLVIFDIDNPSKVFGPLANPIIKQDVAMESLAKQLEYGFNWRLEKENINAN